ncbi:hypothetical protein Glove_139g32 [Diversispora epigaea]|uniref:Uncharacterized protein n=1 Tax=Diversispora epigaea TaxID=1348612 RepID=A0A397IYB3_9GLOM|nr:hypothetical protein Glove_139g32 [Diversispora epigaea]
MPNILDHYMLKLQIVKNVSSYPIRRGDKNLRNQYFKKTIVCITGNTQIFNSKSFGSWFAYAILEQINIYRQLEYEK